MLVSVNYMLAKKGICQYSNLLSWSQNIRFTTKYIKQITENKEGNEHLAKTSEISISIAFKESYADFYLYFDVHTIYYKLNHSYFLTRAVPPPKNPEKKKKNLSPIALQKCKKNNLVTQTFLYLFLTHQNHTIGGGGLF